MGSVIYVNSSSVSTSKKQRKFGELSFYRMISPETMHAYF